MEVYCKPFDEGGNCFRAYKEKAIADIQSELRCSREDAESKLFKSDIDNPVRLSDVDYWKESD